MSKDASFTQHKAGLRLSFEVGEGALTYCARDSSGERDVQLAYEALNPMQTAHLTQRRTPYMVRLALMWLASFMMVPVFMSIDRFAGLVAVGVWMAVSAAAVAANFTGRLNVRFILLHVSPGTPGAWGPVRIIADGEGERILDSIRAAWRAKLKKLYGRADPGADPAREAARLNWLKERGVLTDQEVASELARMALAKEEPPARREARLN